MEEIKSKISPTKVLQSRHPRSPPESHGYLAISCALYEKVGEITWRRMLKFTVNEREIKLGQSFKEEQRGHNCKCQGSKDLLLPRKTNDIYVFLMSSLLLLRNIRSTNPSQSHQTFLIVFSIYHSFKGKYLTNIVHSLYPITIHSFYKCLNELYKHWSWKGRCFWSTAGVLLQ